MPFNISKIIERIRGGEMPDSKVDPRKPRSSSKIKPPEGRWRFAGGKLYARGQELGALIQSSQSKPAAFWSQLAKELDDFRLYQISLFLKKRRKKITQHFDLDELDPSGQLSHLDALVEAYRGKIMRRLKKKYDETADGLSYTLDEDGQLTLNGMNVNAFLAMAKKHPSKKAKLFLKGLKSRLSVILSNKSRNANYEKIREATTQLFKEIDSEIETIVKQERLLEKN